MQDLNAVRHAGLEGSDEGGFSNPCFAGNQYDLPTAELRLRQKAAEPSDIFAPFQQKFFQVGLNSWRVDISNLGNVPSERRFARRKMGRFGPQIGEMSRCEPDAGMAVFGQKEPQ